MPAPANGRRRARKGNVTRLPSGSYRARWTHADGSRGSGTYATESLAWSAVDVNSAARATGQWTPRAESRATLLHVWDEYVAANPTDSGSVERSRDKFRKNWLTGEAKISVDRGRMVLGPRPLIDITESLLHQWVASMVAEGLKTNTIETQWSYMRRVLAFAAGPGQRRIPANPAEGKPRIQASKRRADEKHPHFIRLREMVAIAEASREHERLFIETLLWSGMRQSEVRALDGLDVVATAGLLVVDEAATQGVDRAKVRLKTTKSRASERRVPMPRPVLARLDKAAIAGGVPLLPGRDGSWMDERRADYLWRYTVRTRAGIMGDARDPDRGRRRPPTMHDCRATVTSLLFALGASVPEVMAWVGHSDSETTLRVYATVQGWDQMDPLITQVRNLGLALPQAWDRLYAEAWATYGSDAGRSDHTPSRHLRAI